MQPTGIVTRELMLALKRRFELDWEGIHGVRHWGRVRANALHLAEASGANARVAELFAVLHDVCRMNDGYDPGHGPRAADFADTLQGDYFDLGADEMVLLKAACRGHSDGHIEADLSVQVCWDADRLDLGRVGIQPAPERLCTDAARNPDMLAWAYARSLTTSLDD